MYLKRHGMPKFWPLSRKERKYAVRPVPGPHSMRNCIPLRVVLRDVLGYAETAKEADSAITSGKILVDRKERKDPRFPVGLMDTIEIPSTKEAFRVGVNSAGLFLESIGQGEAGRKLCRITGKTVVKGGLTQLNLHDGRNILLKRNMYSVGDSLLLSLPDQRIEKHFRLAKDSPALIVAGRNKGVKGRIKDIIKRKTMLEKSIAIIESEDGKEIKTPLEYVFVGEYSGAAKSEKKPKPEKKEA